jgi:hypothetical protein
VSQKRKAANDSAWVFLALAHLRLGQRVEAGQCIDKVLDHEAAGNFSWEALEVELLRPNVVELQEMQKGLSEEPPLGFRRSPGGIAENRREG